MHLKKRLFWLSSTERLPYHWCVIQRCSFGFSLAAVVLFLTGCQFHLRNQNTLPPALQHIEVVSDSPYENFTKQLKSELALLSNTPPQGKPAQLIIHNHHLAYHMPIIGSSQQARIYQYTLVLEYSLKIRDNLLIDKKKITVSKLLTLNKNALLSTNNQQALLTTEIQDAAITQLINEIKSPMTRAMRKQTDTSPEVVPPKMDSESPMLPYQDLDS